MKVGVDAEFVESMCVFLQLTSYLARAILRRYMSYHSPLNPQISSDKRQGETSVRNEVPTVLFNLVVRYLAPARLFETI